MRQRVASDCCLEGWLLLVLFKVAVYLLLAAYILLVLL